MWLPRWWQLPLRWRFVVLPRIPFLGSHGFRLSGQFWNVSGPFTNDAVTRKLLFRPVKKLLAHLSAVGEKDAMAFRVQLYQLLFDCYSDREDWSGGLQAVTQAFEQIPKSLHRPLWTSRVVFSSKLGKSVADGLAKGPI